MSHKFGAIDCDKFTPQSAETNGKDDLSMDSKHSRADGNVMTSDKENNGPNPFIERE
jgi:hypothetical protein